MDEHFQASTPQDDIEAYAQRLVIPRVPVVVVVSLLTLPSWQLWVES
jgi:hypothetical protein